MMHMNSFKESVPKNESDKLKSIIDNSFALNNSIWRDDNNIFDFSQSSVKKIKDLLPNSDIYKMAQLDVDQEFILDISDLMIPVWMKSWEKRKNPNLFSMKTTYKSSNNKNSDIYQVYIKLDSIEYFVLKCFLLVYNAVISSEKISNNVMHIFKEYLYFILPQNGPINILPNKSVNRTKIWPLSYLNVSSNVLSVDKNIEYSAFFIYALIDMFFRERLASDDATLSVAKNQLIIMNIISNHILNQSDQKYLNMNISNSQYFCNKYRLEMYKSMFKPALSSIICHFIEVMENSEIRLKLMHFWLSSISSRKIDSIVSNCSLNPKVNFEKTEIFFKFLNLFENLGFGIKINVIFLNYLLKYFEKNKIDAFNQAANYSLEDSCNVLHLKTLTRTVKSLIVTYGTCKKIQVLTKDVLSMHPKQQNLSIKRIISELDLGNISFRITDSDFEYFIIDSIHLIKNMFFSSGFNFETELKLSQNETSFNSLLQTSIQSLELNSSKTNFQCDVSMTSLYSKLDDDLYYTRSGESDVLVYVFYYVSLYIESYTKFISFEKGFCGFKSDLQNY
ncbi:hypothetical protein A3Q56_01715 [Intoshia linei]|uniref:Uncharacterized protein n=1 Tax=Intoshia linei TaxID=1819745 RepID=A0A177B899_9BILA|nr:hypothetical protein A3Q56_01715 [Intoshia linei]